MFPSIASIYSSTNNNNILTPDKTIYSQQVLQIIPKRSF